MPYAKVHTRSFQENALRELARYGAVLRFPKGETIIHEGEHGDRLFVILTGQVGVYFRDASGKEALIRRYDAVNYIGEMALPGLPRCATVRAETPTVCAGIPWEDLQRAVRENPDIALTMITSLIDRHHDTSANLRGLSRLDVYGRVLGLLDSLSFEDLDGEPWSRERLTQSSIAIRVGASRDMVGRILRELQRGGYLRMRDKRFQIMRRLPDRW